MLDIKMTEYYPKISIITPSYNQAKFLDEAIKSVINQNYPNFEHIIFDNCSTDGTIDILKKYPHLIWVSESDKGQSDALNKGFKKATGDFVGWLNADDRYLPDCFYSIAKIAKKSQTPDVIYGDFRWVDDRGNLIKGRDEIDFDLFIFKYLHTSYISSVSAFFRRDIFGEGNFLNTDYKYSMDYEFFLRLALKGRRFIHIRSYLADFRCYSGNKSNLNRCKQIKEREDALLLHDNLMQNIYPPVRTTIRILFMLAARVKRFLLKTVVLLR